MKIDRRTALRSGVLAWPAVAIMPAPVKPRPRYELSALGRQLLNRIHTHKYLETFAWIERARANKFAGWSSEYRDHLQGVIFRWERPRLHRLRAELLRLGF
jgi:hypothetical protein